MQNKFTKGILERQEREYKKQQKEAPDLIPEEVSATENIPVPLTVPTHPSKNLEPTIQPPPLSDNLSDYIERENTRKAKNKTFYLDYTVIQAIKRAATSQHVTESKLVNDILKKILLTR